MQVPDFSMSIERQTSFGLPDMAYGKRRRPRNSRFHDAPVWQISGRDGKDPRWRSTCLHHQPVVTNVTVREPLCTEHFEFWCVALRPFYLPREFNQLFITVVYAPLLPLTSRSLTTRRATYVTTVCLPSAKTLLLSFLATSASAG